MHWAQWTNGGWWHMGAMGLFWLVVIVGVIAVVWAITRAAAQGSAGGPGEAGGRESPEEILKRRYARGEIDREEYERRLDDLRR